MSRRKPIRILPPIYRPMSEDDQEKVIELLSELLLSHFTGKAEGSAKAKLIPKEEEDEAGNR